MDHFLSYKPQISEHITQILNDERVRLSEHQFTAEVFTHLDQMCVAGKMIRGSLLINAVQAFSEDDSLLSSALTAAAALELFESALLIHDDVIDKDQLRRGLETIHHHFSHQYSTHVANSLAMCVGDLGIFLSFRMLNKLSEDHQPQLTSLFIDEFSQVILGEMQDVEMSVSKKEITATDVYQMFRAKTSRYTMCLPLMAAAQLTGQSKEVVEVLSQLGDVLGIIFQVKDDQIGLFGDPQHTGKPVGADILEGKKTLYYVYLLEATSEDRADRDVIWQIFAQKKRTSKDVEKFQELIDKYQIAERVDAELDQLTNQARSSIDQLDQNTRLSQLLTELLQFLLERTK